MTTISEGNRTVSLDAGEWLVRSADGGMVTMGHDIFRRWYDPVDAVAAAALAGKKPRKSHRRKPRRSRASDRQLEVPTRAIASNPVA